MRDTIKKLVNKKYFHICIIFAIIVAILFVLGMVLLRYNVEGETNMPFNLSKITIISSQEGIDKESGENKWAFDVNQNNDIFLYIEKNNEHTSQETIKSVIIDNINISKKTEKGEIRVLKPDVSSQTTMFSTIEENIIDKLEYTGDINSNMQQLKISNQGGVIAFRYSNYKIAEYISNDDEIQFNNLLKNTNITEEDLKATLTFDVTISIESGKEYKANISLEFPLENLIEEGTVSIEITDLDNVIFKRIKN